MSLYESLTAFVISEGVLEMSCVTRNRGQPDHAWLPGIPEVEVFTETDQVL